MVVTQFEKIKVSGPCHWKREKGSGIIWDARQERIRRPASEESYEAPMLH